MANLTASQASRKAMGEIFFALCKRIDSAFSLKCWKLYETNQHLELAETRIDPQHYRSPQRFREDYLVSCYLSKWKELDTGLDLKDVALKKFAASELKCRDTNSRLRARLGRNPDVEAILFLAQRKIADALADYTYSYFLEDCGWGKGATATIKGAEVSLVRKMDPGRTGFISVTRRAVPYVVALLESDPAWFSAFAHAEVEGPYSVVPSRCFEIVRGNRVTTVLKDATSDRTIGAEPTGNIYCQLGVGRGLRRILKKHFGIDLNDQTRNQRLALLGSITGESATVDLKNASNTVARVLVLQQLPYEFFELLDQLRSPEGYVEGEWVRYEMFSSMGNGFTFELESLLFYTIAAATAQYYGHKGRISVYGDDIIYPSCGYDKLKEVLEYVGFEVNTKKTYASGNFRESCGRHYWAGVDVTPIYQKEGFYEDRRKREKEGPRLLLHEAYRCANRILRYAYLSGQLRWFERKYQGWWLSCRRVLELENPRHRIPITDEGDDGLLLAQPELLEGVKARSKHGMVKLPVYSFVPRKLDVSPDEQGALYAVWLRRHRHPREKVSFSRHDKLNAFVDRMCSVSEHYVPITEQVVRDHLAGTRNIAYYIPAGRLGYYVSRRRMYPIGTPYVAWM